jgi:hypothetical protein
MREFPECESADPYIIAETIRVSLLCALLRVACSSTLIDCVARKVGAVARLGGGLGEGERQ